MLEGFDVMQAEAFTRLSHAGRPEAVAFFWVRRGLADHRGPLAAADVEAVRDTLVPLLRGEVGVRRARSTSVATPAAAETSVCFIEREAEPWLTLELHTNDRSGLLLAVSAALFREGIQISGSRVTTEGTRVHDRFDLVDADGSRIPRGRLQRIQLAVLAAVDGY
jgi:UTP:GlnB (protein PII) uridylyltransferase